MSLTTMIESSPVAAVVSDPRLPDNPIIACNTAFEMLTGFARHEIIGHNCRFLTGPGTEGHLTQRLREGISARRPTIVEILNYKKDGTPFRNAVMVAPMFDADGNLEYFLGSQVELGHNANAEMTARQQAAIARIEALSRRQREILVHLAKGKLNKQMAYLIGVSERTIKMHRNALLKALDMRSTADLIRLAIEAGF